jgi:hypothetical protein
VHLILVRQEECFFLQWGWEINSDCLLLTQKYRESKWKQGAEVGVNHGITFIK